MRPANLGQKLEPVDAGHGQVSEDNVEVAGRQGLERPLSIDRRLNLPGRLSYLHHSAQARQHPGVVVDQEDAWS